MISVIVPVYNAEKYLNRCVKSILKQKDVELEIILIDDGSKDNSLCMCRELETLFDNIKVYHQDNRGVSAARNFGIEKAKGEYIAFVDSDDYIGETYFRNALFVQNKYDSKRIVINAIMKFINEENQTVMQFENKDFSILEKNQILKIYNSFLFNSPVNKLFKRDVILENNIRFREKLSIGEDMLFNMQYMEVINFEGFVILNYNYYIYMQENQDSLSKKYVQGYYEIHKMLMEKLRGICESFGVRGTDWEIYDKFVWRYFELSFINIMKESNSMAIVEKLKYNTDIMHQKLFQDTLNKMKKHISRIEYLGYKTRNYSIYLGIVKLKQLILRGQSN